MSTVHPGKGRLSWVGHSLRQEYATRLAFGQLADEDARDASGDVRRYRPGDDADPHTDPHLELAAGAVIGERAGNGLRKVLRWPLDATPRRPFEANSFYF